MKQQLLAQLKPPVVPSEVSAWPPSWPVVLLALSALLSVIVLLWLWFRHRQAQRLRKLVLNRLLAQPTMRSSDITLLLKQLCLGYVPQARSLLSSHGADFAALLTAANPNHLLELNWLQGQYQQDDPFQRPYYQFAKSWLTSLSVRRLQRALNVAPAVSGAQHV